MTFQEIWISMLQLAGCTGMNPFEFSFAELYEMAKSKDVQAWRHTLLVFSSNFQPKRQMFTNLYPYTLDTDRTKSKEEFSKEKSAVKERFS